MTKPRKPKQSSVPRISKHKPMPNPTRKRTPKRTKRARIDYATDIDDRIGRFTEIAIRAAVEVKDDDLTDEEIEGVLEYVGFYLLALAHGLDPHAWADLMRATAEGTYTIQ